MKRIAILGCENSHADIFLSLVSERAEFSDLQVAGVFSEDRSEAEKLNEKYGAPVMESPADLVGKIDGLLITARHGDRHYPYLKPYLEDKIPVFIDKPITISESDAVALAADLKQREIKVLGGSVLKYDDAIMRLKDESENEVGGKTLGGSIIAPYQANNPYGGFFFYAPHGVEMVLQIFGRYPMSVSAKEGENKQIHIIFRYEEFCCEATLRNEDYTYSASLTSEKGESKCEIFATNEWFYREFSRFYKLLCGGNSPESYSDIIAPVFVLNAIYRSIIGDGSTENVSYPTL